MARPLNSAYRLSSRIRLTTVSVVGAEELLKRARLAAGKSQMDVAWLSGTSRPTLSAYEHGRKSPTLATATRILRATGHDLAIQPRVGFDEHHTDRGEAFTVPDRLFRLPVHQAFARIRVRDVDYDLADRAQRRLAYQMILAAGKSEDILDHVDGALLTDLWPELILPAEVRDAWQPLIDGALSGDPVRT